MEENFNYQDVPKNYVYCLNNECTHSSDCLRFKVTLHVDKNISSFRTVNPVYVAQQKECFYFQSDRLTRFALGITHLFDELPHEKAVKIRNILYKYFKLNMFYRIQNKQRLIKPEEQDYIRQVFANEGILEEPVFDEYVDRYNWH